MTILGAIFIVSFIMVSCGQNSNKQKELELKERELALKEKEFTLDSVQKTSSNKTLSVKSLQTEIKNNKSTPILLKNNDGSVFLGKWKVDGPEIYTIAKKGNMFYLMADWSNECDPNTIDGLYLYAKLKLINGELVGPFECAADNTNSIFKIIGKEIHVIENGKIIMTLYRK